LLYVCGDFIQASWSGVKMGKVDSCWFCTVKYKIKPIKIKIMLQS